MASPPDYRGHSVVEPVDPFRDLRKRASNLAAASERGQPDPAIPGDAQVLLEDLRIHQIELELQNEELRRVQADLELSRSRYFDLYNLAPAGFVTVNADGAITELNLRASTLFAASRSSLMRRQFTRFISMESQDTFHLTRARLLQSGKPQVCELRMIRPDNPPFWARMELILAQEDGQQVFRAVIVDISDRKRLEEALGDANTQLSAEKAVAEEATQAKSQFLSAMTHEIRTPLNGVVGMAGLLAQTELNEEQRSYARIVTESAEALLGLVNNILDFSKIEAGRLELDEAPFDLSCLVEDVIDIMSFKAREKSLELACRYQPGVPRRFVADASRIRQILMNFISNAIKFTESGYVLVEVECGDCSEPVCNMRLCVQDTGIGISKQNLSHLFIPFSQADPSIATRYGGTGLGLSIVKEIAELMGGQLAVTSLEGKGSSFSCTLPLKLDALQPSPESADLISLPVLISGSLQIMRSVIAEWCQLWGMSVQQCRLEELAVELDAAAEQQRPFPLVIIDAGVEALLDALVTIHSYAGPPPKVVLLTAESLEQAKHLPADTVISMPVRARTLWEHVRELLRVAAGSSPHPPSAKPPTPSLLSGCSVLVTDDNPVNQKLTCALLAKLGCQVDTASNGSEAVAKAARHEYGLVLMDCIMPVMDGFAATAAIRALPGAAGRVPIVALTASATEEDRHRCLVCGMNDFLTKPVRSDQLAACLATWLKKPAAVAATAN